VLITHSPQLASNWKYRYSAMQSLHACETPTICTWSAWLSELFQQTSQYVCLKSMQEQLLWQQIIKQDLKHLPERSIRGLAKQASQAYALMQSYQIPAQQIIQAGGEEAEALIRWVDALHSKLQQPNYQRYILKADLSNYLLKAQATLELPTSIILDGFENLTPSQTQQLEMYVAMGCSIFQVQSQQSAKQVSLHPCQDAQAEYQHLALQTKQILDNNPQARIALVSVQNDSPTELRILKRQMQKALALESCLHPDQAQQSIAMHESLADTPMVQQALHLLTQCAHHDIAFEDFSVLLLCPWLRGFEYERMKRAELDALFRQQNRHRIQWKSLKKSSSLNATPALRECIEYIANWQEVMPKEQACADWIKACQKILQRCGFMQAGLEHEVVRSALEIQLMNNLHKSITQLIALDAIQQHCTWAQFLTYLRTSCTETPIPQTSHFQTISILTMPQAIGMQFDYMLIYGMDDANFPPVAKPQSFLPMRIQQDYHIPMSHGALIYASCQWLWQQMQHTAPSIMVSYAMLRDEQSMQASSFVAHLPHKAALYDSTPIEHWENECFDDAQPVPVTDTQHIHGGTSIIKHQSACPFRAFAVHRLGIKPLGETVAGIEPSTKGSLLHLALEYIWQHLLSQQKLLNMTSEQRQQLINAGIEHAWQTTTKAVDFHSQAVEKKRMQKLLQQWLELEAQRPAFQIDALEKTYQLSLPSHAEPALAITIKADRMDKDSHGHRLLIDYKTGRKQTASQWLGERMAEPQLPMYALAADLGPQDAVSFASVRSGDDMGFEGLSGEDIAIKGLIPCDGKRNRPDDWQAVLTAWKEQINALAQEFMQGHSDVLPRNKQACDYCKLEAICRIDELSWENQA